MFLSLHQHYQCEENIFPFKTQTSKVGFGRVSEPGVLTAPDNRTKVQCKDWSWVLLYSGLNGLGRDKWYLCPLVVPHRTERISWLTKWGRWWKSPRLKMCNKHCFAQWKKKNLSPSVSILMTQGRGRGQFWLHLQQKVNEQCPRWQSLCHLSAAKIIPKCLLCAGKVRKWNSAL